MTAPHLQITAAVPDVNAHLANLLSERVAALMERPPDSERGLEVAVWAVVIEVGAALLTACLAQACVLSRAPGPVPFQSEPPVACSGSDSTACPMR